MPRYEYLLRDENYQRTADIVAVRALGLAYRANALWEDTLSGTNPRTEQDFARLKHYIGNAIGRGSIAEMSPTITDPIEHPKPTYITKYLSSYALS